MDYKNSYFKFKNKEERIEYWKKARLEYSAWRKTSTAKKLLSRKIKKQQGLCFWCMLPLDELVHIDHIFPLYLGGSNGAINMCATHPKCNMDKGAKVLINFKQAGHRRRQFKALRKAKRANELIAKRPNAKISKKNATAIRLSKSIKPIIINR